MYVCASSLATYAHRQFILWRCRQVHMQSDPCNIATFLTASDAVLTRSRDRCPTVRSQALTMRLPALAHTPQASARLNARQRAGEDLSGTHVPNASRGPQLTNTNTLRFDLADVSSAHLYYYYHASRSWAIQQQEAAASANLARQ